jgi:hypothetical protein
MIIDPIWKERPVCHPLPELTPPARSRLIPLEFPPLYHGGQLI